MWQQHNGTPLMGKTVVITAGATVEAIDPVRFLSNHSTGKMGYALAAACRDAGAKVLLVAGRNVSLPTPFGVKKITVGSADELLQACLPLCAKADVLIATAAVADFKMAQIAPQKIKKTAKDDSLQLTLCQNPDVLATMSATYPALFCVGFAAETHEVQRYAQDKLRKKNLAMIVCNDVSDKSIGFASDDNAVTVFFARHFAKAPLSLPKATKRHIAEQLVLAMSALLPTNA